MPICSVAGCSKDARNGGMCWGHYHRTRRHGDPLAGSASPGESLEARLERGLPADRDPAKCWPWQRGRNTSGYGVVTRPGGGRTPAHRAAYEIFVGPIPDGLEPDHLCKNKSCVNPAHLELVTHSENVRRGWPDRRARSAAA